MHSEGEEALQSSEFGRELAEKIGSALKFGEFVFGEGEDVYYFQPIRSRVNADGRKIDMISFFDISKRKHLQAESLAKQEMFQRLSEHLPEGIVMFGEQILYCNPAFEKLVGYSGSELLEVDFSELIKGEDRAWFEGNLQMLRAKKKSLQETQLQLITKTGKEVWARVKTRMLRYDEEGIFLNIVTNITSEKEKLDFLSKLAYYDGLTGIYNRRKFNELLQIEYRRAKRYHRHLSALFFDIDHFKKVNDTYGHDVGDEVLVGMARLIEPHIRETDIFARWGGEEFIVLLPETTAENALILAEHIRTAVSEHHFGKVGHVTVSIGLTILKGKERIETMIKRLDNALYKAKESGRNRSCEL